MHRSPNFLCPCIVLGTSPVRPRICGPTTNLSNTTSGYHVPPSSVIVGLTLCLSQLRKQGPLPCLRYQIRSSSIARRAPSFPTRLRVRHSHFLELTYSSKPSITASESLFETHVQSSSEPQNPHEHWTPNTEGLRGPRQRRATGSVIDSDCKPKHEEYVAFESEASCGSTLTPRCMSLVPPMVVKACDDDSGREDEPIVLSPRIMPMYTDEASNMSMRGSLPFAKWCADALRPYHELCEAKRDGDAGKTEEVLKRLLTEWDVVGRSVSLSALYVATPPTLSLRRNSSWRLQASTSRCYCSGLRRTGYSPTQTGSRGSGYRSVRSLRAWGSSSTCASSCATPARA